MSSKKDKPFVEGITLGPMLGLSKEEEGKEDDVAPNIYPNFYTEILDQEEGWIYERKMNGKKGKRLRKFFERLGRGYSDEGITFWRPKLDDIAYCEAKRWKAKLYATSQYKKVIGAFDLVLNNTPFSCIRITEQYPGFAWVEFPHNNSGPYDRGVSWDWWESSYRNKNKSKDRPESPLKQDVGDAWFNYEDRSREIRQRVGYFELLFHQAIEKKYSQGFYRERHGNTKIKLVINGREYLIGMAEGRSFGVIAYPEDTITQVIEPLSKVLQ